MESVGLTTAPGFLRVMGRLTIGFGMLSLRVRTSEAEHKPRLHGGKASREFSGEIVRSGVCLYDFILRMFKS
jgi:hypothetical protein